MVCRLQHKKEKNSTKHSHVCRSTMQPEKLWPSRWHFINMHNLPARWNICTERAVWKRAAKMVKSLKQNQSETWLQPLTQNDKPIGCPAQQSQSFSIDSMVCRVCQGWWTTTFLLITITWEVNRTEIVGSSFPQSTTLLQQSSYLVLNRPTGWSKASEGHLPDAWSPVKPSMWVFANYTLYHSLHLQQGFKMADVKKVLLVLLLRWMSGGR